MSCPPVGVGQDALEDVLNANAGRDYTVIRGDSPASIARKFGVSLDQLLNANPQKATTVVRGVRTWTSLSINEGLSLPKAGVRLGYVAQAAGKTTMPSIADLLAQGYVATTNNCFAGEYCYIKEVPLVAGNQSRTYTFVSNDPASRAMGTSVSVPTGQGQVPSIWPAASGVAPVPVDTPSAVQQAAPLAVTPVARVAHHGLSTGAMIGIGVGVAAVVGVVIYASSGKRR